MRSVQFIMRSVYIVHYEVGPGPQEALDLYIYLIINWTNLIIN